jgi:type VI secretion system protein ImpG
MNREFLELYDRELKILYERAKDFGEEYAGIGERLGGLTEEKMDPGLVGLLEGAAFMAARVQLKLRSEFSEFTSALLEQLVPNYLAPIASAVLVEAQPAYDDPKFADGVVYPAGAYVDAVYIEHERRVQCRYRLARELAMWPLSIEKAEYYSGPAPLQALGLDVLAGTGAGLRLTLHRRTAKPTEESQDKPIPGAPVGALTVDRLPIHIVGSASDAIAIYEQLFANCRRIVLRYLDSFGDAKFRFLPLSALEQIGFGQDERLFGTDDRIFAGFELLREFFAFPQKFTGFQLTGLRRALAGIEAHSVDLLFEFDQPLHRLASIVNRSMFALYAVPAANLFEMTCSRIPVSRNEHEHHVVPDRTRWLDFEAHRIIDVFAHYPGNREKVRVFPLYSLPTGNVPIAGAMFYTVRRQPRRATAQERRFGTQSGYVGTELFLSLGEPVDIDEEDRVRELSVRALTSNRHLTDQLPVGEAGADFVLVDDTKVPLKCIAGPTRPRESIIHMEKKKRETVPTGHTMWKLVNLLSLNHLGLTDRSPQDRAGGLRELLGLFADLSDVVTESRIRGIQGISSRAMVRRLKQENGFNAARGIEITVTIDEKAFEGNGIFVLGAVLDRFFAEYTSINSFTETVIESAQRGVVKRWPPRAGSGRLL